MKRQYEMVAVMKIDRQSLTAENLDELTARGLRAKRGRGRDKEQLIKDLKMADALIGHWVIMNAGRSQEHKKKLDQARADRLRIAGELLECLILHDA